MAHEKFFKAEAEVTPKNLGEAIQQAIEIEIATIPVYLYTYYSINRSPNQDTIKAELLAALLKKGKSKEEAEALALDLSASIMVYANKAGALIMSVAIEEMLHMALSSNLKQALAGMPELVGKSPSQWPACLPGHEPPFDINRAKLSLKQLMTFLYIESPKPLKTEEMMLQALPYKTIGEFYGMIISCIEKNDLKYNTHLPQLVPGKGYYAQNNIDTVYYDKKHNPQFVNADDSGDLLVIKDRKTALQAIECIVEQGEGNPDAPGLVKGCVDCTKFNEDKVYDDKDKKELSHFEKFEQIYCEYESLSKKFTEILSDDPKQTFDIGKYFVMNVADNPMTADYPAQIQAVSNFLNGVYTYLYVMTEGCYRQAGNTQYEIFMFGIHKSMIFILNSVCGDIMKLTYVKGGVTYNAAPTFEDYPFSNTSSPKSQLVELYNKAVAAYPAINYLGQRVLDLPDVALTSQETNNLITA